MLERAGALQRRDGVARSPSRAQRLEPRIDGERHLEGDDCPGARGELQPVRSQPRLAREPAGEVFPAESRGVGNRSRDPPHGELPGSQSHSVLARAAPHGRRAHAQRPDLSGRRDEEDHPVPGRPRAGSRRVPGSGRRGNHHRPQRLVRIGVAWRRHVLPAEGRQPVVSHQSSGVSRQSSVVSRSRQSSVVSRRPRP